jgi:acetyl-CoA/propionyl-CoA carboxylase biotin carboxyl carrier protein
VSLFGSVLIANRGEISRRVTRTLARLGIRSIAVYTDADAGAPHMREADEAVHVSSYLDIEAVIEAAKASGADAVHPGYGFLSENAAFARACADADIVFIGPSGDAMEAMGDKVKAKEVAAKAGVPTVPSYSVDEAREATDDYPLLVKAAAGGGGRGMRVVDAPENLDDAIDAAKREAKAGFGDDRVFIERYLPKARHIEVQVIGDVALGERECSLQRRHQKIVEEAPSPAVSPELREQLCSEASALARAAGYENAGTVEFIADFDDPSTHFFLEMNARLQVEHPVTELVTGLDLVEQQLRAAAGLPVAPPELNGHAIEVRINAEDAAAGFLPATGTVLEYRRPSGVRVDDAIEQGSVVGTDYDSLLAKVIVHGEDRPTALAKLDRALAKTAILGVTTNTGFLRSLLQLPEVRDGAIDTGLVERTDIPDPPFDHEDVVAAAARIEVSLTDGRKDGWRLGGVRAPSWWLLAVEGGEPIDVQVPAGEQPDPRWVHAREGDILWVGREGYAWRVRHPSIEEAHEQAVEGDLRAPMPGSVLVVKVSEGDEVSAGDTLIVLESMKMELSIDAPADGTVAELSVSEGDQVKQDQPLVRVEVEGEDDD